MGRDRLVWVCWALCVVLCGVAVWTVVLHWAQWKIGDVDPLGSLAGLGGLLAAVVAVRQSRRAEQDTALDVVVWADRLAVAVLEGETRQRSQLLGGQPRTIDLAFVFTPAPAPGHDAAGAGVDGTLSGIVGYFEELRPRRLVITGEAGSGKTVTAIELILLLLESRQPGGPVPVRVSAASWNPADGVPAWLTARLTADYRMAPQAARALVAAGKVLPVIDGLDEMDHLDVHPFASHAARALDALNTYQHGTALAQVVLTCRTGHYDALTGAGAYAYDAARITLTPLAQGQAEKFLTAVTGGGPALDRWRPVLDALTQPGHPLAEALSTPWRLTLAAIVYTQRHPANGAYLRDPDHLTTLTGPDDVRAHLLGHYIPAACAAATSRRHSPERVHRWLARLARYLNDNTTRPPFHGRTLSSTDLILHELWPLAGNFPHLLTTILATLLIAPVLILMAVVYDGWSEAVGMIFFGLSSVAKAWLQAWTEPSRLDITQIATRVGARRFAGVLGVGLMGGAMFGLMVGSSFGWLLGLVVVLVVVLTGGLTGGLMFVFRVSSVGGGTSPRELVKKDVIAWLVVGPAVGMTGVLVVVLLGGLLGWLPGGLPVALPVGLAGGLAVGLTGGPVGGPAGVRYVMLLIVSRGRLPWRLGRFLDWCYTDLGLIRVSGIAYQFRHRELQDYLATRPHLIPPHTPWPVIPPSG